MRVIVLGHTGYLGGHTAARLRATDGVRVVTAGRSPHADLPVDLAGVSVDALVTLLQRMAARDPSLRQAIRSRIAAIRGNRLPCLREPPEHHTPQIKE